MRFIADLHIHSRYSLATSSQLTPEMLDLWGRKKGIMVVGTGDAIHPKWFDELKEKLTPAQNGLFRLKKDLVHNEAARYGDQVYFMLCSEISCIYKKNGRVRKVHNLVYAPSFSAMARSRNLW
jgi:PHP family Zn ribbon phosphoesterase